VSERAEYIGELDPGEEEPVALRFKLSCLSRDEFLGSSALDRAVEAGMEAYFDRQRLSSQLLGQFRDLLHELLRLY
jgi:hypothetical protein